MKKTLIIDNHVHVGWYTDGYHSPTDVWNIVQAVGISEIVVSSTSTCANLYNLVLEEMKELLSLGGDRVHPVLWVTPQMIQTSTINNMLNSGIKWQMLKMHWKAHPEWYNNKLLSKQAIELAQHLKIPILLHTGLFEECRAGIFEDICIENNKTVFVLAHGCPLNETINIMQKCNNVYVDTAFMQAKDVNELIQKGFLCRILYGSDTPINEVYFPKLSTKNYLLNEMRNLEKIIGHKNYQVICQRKVVGRL